MNNAMVLQASIPGRRAGAWLLCALLGWLAGCAAPDPSPLPPGVLHPAMLADGGGTLSQAAARHSPVEAASASAEPEGPLVEEEEAPDSGYVLQPGDEIDIQVYREPDLSGVFRVTPSGDIRHPLAGAVPLAGRTLKRAESDFTAVLARDYLVNPRVIFKMVSAQSSQIVLLGEVKNPGVYPLPVGEPMTLLQAIAGAGGFTDLASPDRVRIVRRLPDGRTTTLRIRVSSLLAGRRGHRDLPLEPNDVIMVPEVVF